MKKEARKYTDCVLPWNNVTVDKEGAKGLPVLKVGTEEMKDASFVGMQIYTMLTTVIHMHILIKKIVIEGSTIRTSRRLILSPPAT